MIYFKPTIDRLEFDIYGNEYYLIMLMEEGKELSIRMDYQKAEQIRRLYPMKETDRDSKRIYTFK